MRLRCKVLGVITMEGYRLADGEYIPPRGVRWLVCLNADTAKYFGVSARSTIYISKQRPGSISQQVVEIMLDRNAKTTIEFDTLEQAITCCDLTD